MARGGSLLWDKPRERRVAQQVYLTSRGVVYLLGVFLHLVDSSMYLAGVMHLGGFLYPKGFMHLIDFIPRLVGLSLHWVGLSLLLPRSVGAGVAPSCDGTRPTLKPRGLCLS